MRSLVAGVDTSTQSCKVELRDAEDFQLVAMGSAPHPPVTPPRSEQDPADWWTAFVAAFRQALSRVPDEARVGAISVAGQCHGLVPLDEAGEVIRPAKLWNDTTTDGALRDVRRAIGDRAFIERTGSLPTAAFTLSKVAWLRVNEPENFRRMRTMLLPHDYLTYRLTGEFVTDRSEASGTAYFDADRNEYVFEFLKVVDGETDWPSMVPRVAGPDEVVGIVQPEVLAELGLSGEVRVGAGAGDQHASAVGLGLDAGELVVALGTSGVVFTPSPQPVRDPHGLINGVAGMPGGFLPLACTINCAKVTDAMALWLGVDHDELSRLALAAGDDGPILVPFFDGERTPNRPGASGIFVDLRTDTTREQLARAAYEGVVHALASGVEHMIAQGIDIAGDVIAVGGGARAQAYTQILADVLGRAVHTADAPEAVARGAAVQAHAILSGGTLTGSMREHRPQRLLAARPRPRSAERWARYQEAAGLTSLDRDGG